MNFVGRENELRLLDELWQSGRPEFLFMPGRRRVGKTELIFHWLHTRRPEKSLYWVAENDSSQSQLSSFSSEIYTLGAGRTLTGPFTFGNWRQAFEEIGRAAADQRVVVILDEFTYLLASDQSAGSALQHAWDGVLKRSNVFLIVTGSHMGLMSDVVNRKGPLYNRPTAELVLPPLPFSATRQFFPRKLSVDDRVAYYACFGGIPGYWDLVRPELSVLENIFQIFVKRKYMANEAETMLYDFVRESHNYASLLRAIASGARTYKEMEVVTGIPNTSVAKYIHVLMSAGYVIKKSPLTKPAGRNSRYFVADPALRFQHRFFQSRGSQLARGISQHVMDDIQAQLPLFIGEHTWEELCRDWLWLAGNHGLVPMPLEVGSTWTRQVQIDIVGMNPRERKLILGEAKWTQSAEPRRTLEDLVHKVPLALPTGKKVWEVTLLGMSRSGWKATAIEYANELNGAAVVVGSEGRWKLEKILLRDLSTIDQELETWGAKIALQ
jgi:AAA+ ATPase superfamily predicted ATPase